MIERKKNASGGRCSTREHEREGERERQTDGQRGKGRERKRYAYHVTLYFCIVLFTKCKQEGVQFPL